MNSKKSSKSNDKASNAVPVRDIEKVGSYLFLAALLIVPSIAMAADVSGAGSIFCSMAQNLKGVVGVCMGIAVLLWAIEHIFKVSKIHEVVMAVGIASLVVSLFTIWLASGTSPFTSSCTF